MVSENAFEHRNWVLSPGCAARVNLLQCQDVWVGAANEGQHAIEIMAAVRPHFTMDVPCHNANG